jgi:hypothetical protein
MTVCIYVDTSKAVGDPEGVAFEYMFGISPGCVARLARRLKRKSPAVRPSRSQVFFLR